MNNDSIIETLRRKGYRVKCFNSTFVDVYKGDMVFHCIGLDDIKNACKMLGVTYPTFTEKEVATYL
jgi:hypothetical protein